MIKPKFILRLLDNKIDSADIKSNIIEFITGKLEFPKVIMQNNPGFTSYKVFKINLNDWPVDDATNSFLAAKAILQFVTHDYIIQFINNKKDIEPYNYPPNIMYYYKDLLKIYDKFYFAEQLNINGKTIYKCKPNNLEKFEVIESVSLSTKKYELVESSVEITDKNKIPSEKRVSYLLNDLAIKLDPKNSQDYEDSDDDESDEEDAEIDAYYEEQYLNSLANPSIVMQEMADAIYGDDEILPSR